MRLQDINKKDVCFGGQLYVKFPDYIHKGSAHIAVQQAGLGRYVALTSKSNIKIKDQSAIDGYFFLQKAGERNYLARFHFTANDIMYLDSPVVDDKSHSSGDNLVAIHLNMMICHGELPDVPPL